MKAHTGIRFLRRLLLLSNYFAYLCSIISKYIYFVNSMEITLEVPDSKAAFVMELFANLSFVKTKSVTKEKNLLLEELKEAVDNLNRVKKGALKARPVKELLDEL